MYPYCQKNHEVYERWMPISNGERTPTPDEARLMQVVQQALDSGLFYESDVQKYVKEHADFIPPEAWEIKGNTEGGVMGYESFHARSAIRDIATRKENEEAVKLYTVGQKIGTLYINAKRVNALVITDIKDIGVVMVGKMGTNTVQFTINARAIKQAKERAIQRGWCKS